MRVSRVRKDRRRRSLPRGRLLGLRALLQHRRSLLWWLRGRSRLSLRRGVCRAIVAGIVPLPPLELAAAPFTAAAPVARPGCRGFLASALFAACLILTLLLVTLFDRGIALFLSVQPLHKGLLADKVSTSSVTTCMHHLDF